MADCRPYRLQLVTDYRRLTGGEGGSGGCGGDGKSSTGGRRGAWRRGYRCGLAVALLLTTGSLLLSGVCLWSQRDLEAENFVVREDLEFLETKLQMVEEKLLKSRVDGGSPASAVEADSEFVELSRLRRSNSDSTRRRRTHPKAAHFRLDASTTGSTTTDLKWKIWTGSDSAAERNSLPFSFDTIRLSEDKKSLTITEPGLYFIYAQINFENAKLRNAFAVKVDDLFVMKCFQSLDYFNQSLTSTENSRLKPCYSAATIVLRRNQVVTVSNLYPHNRIINDPYANFWGLVKLAEN